MNDQLHQMFYKLTYFKQSNEGICADDFKEYSRNININLNHVISISELEMFKTPFSNTNIANYSEVKTINNDTYYIKEKSFNNIISSIEKIKNYE